MNRCALVVAMLLTAPALGQMRWGLANRPATPPQTRPLQLGPGSAPAATRPSTVAPGALTLLEGGKDAMKVALDRRALTSAAAGGAFVIPGLRLSEAGQTLDLEVERFRITTPTTRFVRGRADGRDEPLPFDPESVILLRGRVAGYTSSHLYLAVSPSMVNGIIDLGPGHSSFGVSSKFGGGRLPDGQAAIFRSLGSGGPNPSPFCEVRHSKHEHPGGSDGLPVKGMRQLEMAVETDHEFLQVVGSEIAAAEYLLQMYGAVSDVYIREINTRVDIVYARVWPQPNEPFEAGLNPLVAYWQANMGAVQRDVVQMFSGRGDLPGGVAYLSQLCASNAYGFCGNLVGFFADPQSSSVFNYDPMVAAHELGHNCGTQHTDFYGLDICNAVNTPPQRGTIMAYCNQTVSGAMAVEDLTFHKVTREAMLDYIVTRPACIVFDCNQNGISDAVDISSSTSPDVNGNSIPDECEDCNNNQVLDSIDIGTISFDLNGNGIPDECEPDCNNNNVPDDRDILLGTSIDLHGDGIPDECDADLNTNNQSDYNEIMANMTLDVDRNRMLDSRQDCDNDGTPDLVELDGAHNGWLASSTQQALRGYHSITGVLMNTSPNGATTPVRDLIITPDRRILVAAANGVREYNSAGAFVRTLVAIGSGGLGVPSALVIRSTGTLLVADRTGNRVLEYNLGTGAFIGTFVAAGLGSLAAPMGLTFGPSGNLFVTSETNSRVIQYDGGTGALVNTFVAASSGGLAAPKGLVFNPVTGNLLVASYGSDDVLEYNGTTGAFIKIWSIVGVHFDGPWCLRIGRDGQVYVSINIEDTDTHLTRAKVQIFNAASGNFIRAYVQANDSLVLNPTGFDFMPGDATDCNRNQLPDSCDITSGFSLDFNNNGKPDECERTCYANCDLSTGTPVLTANDFACFLNAYASGFSYANCDGSAGNPALTANDFACFLNQYADGCP